MTIYAVIRKSDSTEVTRVSINSLFEVEGFPFSLYNYIEKVDSDSPVVQSLKITRLAFRNRFTANEKLAIELAATDNPTAADGWRSFSAALRSNMQDIQVAEFIDLQLPDTRAGVQNLEAVGLLAAGRAAVILDTEPTAEERWNG